MSERPDRLTPEMALKVAIELAKTLRRDCDMEDSSENELAAAIARYARPHMDGYDLAKELDDCAYWDCNLQIAETLDGFASLARDEIEAAEKEWAARENIVPPLPLGTRVRFGSRPETGVLEAVDTYGAAKYLIKFDGGANANSRRVVNFEDVTPEHSPSPHPLSQPGA